MNLYVMKTFCDLVDTGSFSRAAESNFVSQSAVSQQLAKLERDLGIKLISRGGGVVEPTPAGRTFYDGAKEIIRRYEQLIGEVKSAEETVRGVLRVGTIYSVGFYLLDPFVRQFIHDHAEVTLHVTYTGWNQISAAVISGEMNLGVVACPERHRSLDVIPLAEEELVMVCAPDHPLANKENIKLRELEDEPIVAFEASVPTRRLIEQQFKNRKIKYNVTMEFDNIELLKRAVMVGAGVSILPRAGVEQEVVRGDLAVATLSGEGWTRPVGILRRRGRHASLAEKLFLNMLQKQ